MTSSFSSVADIDPVASTVISLDVFPESMASPDQKAIFKLLFDRWYAKRFPDPRHENPTWNNAIKVDCQEVWMAACQAMNLSPGFAGWRPMESVPKDGTEVILWLRAPYSRMDLLCWNERVNGWITRDADPETIEGCTGALVPEAWMPKPLSPHATLFAG